MSNSYVNYGFNYRATLCVSAVFAVARCPSVRTSVTLMDCIHRAEDIVKFLSQPGSPHHSSFWPHAPIPNSKGNPFSGGAKVQVVGIFFAIFDGNQSPSISETVRDRRRGLPWNVNRKMRSIERWHFQPPWRTPNPVFEVTAFLKSNI